MPSTQARLLPPDGRTGPAAPQRVVVYTAISDHYDVLKEQPHAVANDAAFVAFLDEPCESTTWRAYPAHAAFADPTRNAKIHKVLSHVYFPDAEYTLWIDGSATILDAQPIQQLVDTYLADCDVAVFRHRLRTCLYQEASVCLQRRLDDPDLIWQQICRYTREHYPLNAGLGECPVVLRRHTPRVRAFNEAWWDEISVGSRRDQLSFDYVAHKLGLRYSVFAGTIADNPWFRREPHARPRPLPSGPSRATGLRSSANGAGREAVSAPPMRAAGRAAQRKTVAFGQVLDQGSWSWAGFEVARELSKHYEVLLYDDECRPPPCDVLFQIKRRPTAAFVDAAQRNGSRLVYCPIDAYRSAQEIIDDGEQLRACAAVLVHCERLLPLLRPHCANAHFVDHYTRYALREMADYKPHGFILWVGRCEYLPYQLRWLEQHPIAHEIRLLTDLDSERGRRRAVENAERIGLALALSDSATSLAGCRVYRWSERRQEEMMRACKAALDVKQTDLFNQHHKPPTKAQQYVASGIPCAVNPQAYSAEYFRRRGFDPASPADGERWLSHEYWRATRVAGARLREETSLAAVTARYRALIDSL